MTPPSGRACLDQRLLLASVLTEIGDLAAAEAQVLRLLGERPRDREALSLLAKIKHIRGELSAAFACWAQLNALAPEGEGARMRLASMLRLAQDPERGAAEFLALGQNQLWRKPAALLELEGAFRLFVALRPDDARVACARLAQKSREQDRDLYKLAVLAEAWIAELAGDLEPAARLLEELGKERAFAGDTDRALALVRVYEQLARPADLEKAIHVCEYLVNTLNGFERVTELGRLAALCRAVGNEADAADYDRQFLVAFLARMHRPTLAEALTAASRHYLPLPRLAAARFAGGVDLATDADLPPGADPPPVTGADPSAGADRSAGGERPSDAGAGSDADSDADSGGDAEADAAIEPRRRALGLALRGDLAAARQLLEHGGKALDRKYLADIAQLEGRPELALRLFLSTVAGEAETPGEPDDPRVIGWLLDHAGGPEGEPVRDFFAPAERARRAVALLEAQVREAPRRPAAWRQLAALQRLRGDETEARRCAERAVAMAAAEARRESAVGRVLSAAVYHFAGRAKGLVHEVWAARKPVAPGHGGFLDETLGNMTPELTQAVRNTFLAVREYARANLPHLTGDILDFNYSYKITKEDEPSGGLSAGLPTALAFLSVFLDRPVRQDLATTGILVADAHDVLVVRPVGEVEEKVRGAYNRNLRLVILPSGNRGDLEQGFQVPRPIWQEVVAFVPDLDSAVKLVFGDLD